MVCGSEEEGESKYLHKTAVSCVRLRTTAYDYSFRALEMLIM